LKENLISIMHYKYYQFKINLMFIYLRVTSTIHTQLSIQNFHIQPKRRMRHKIIILHRQVKSLE